MWVFYKEKKHTLKKKACHEASQGNGKEKMRQKKKIIKYKNNYSGSVYHYVKNQIDKKMKVWRILT